MKLESVNLGRPKAINWAGKSLRTAFVKQPALLPLRLTDEGLEGDAQADRRVHGGPDKTAYAYPMEHRAFWRRQLERPLLGPGAFAENFSTEGLLETKVLIGERFLFGEALVEISQPRFPCHKMAACFRREDLPHLFRRSGRSGFYLRVLEEGKVAAGDAIVPVQRPVHGLSVHALVKLFFSRTPDWGEVAAALEVEGLPAEWRDPLHKRWQERR